MRGNTCGPVLKSEVRSLKSAAILIVHVLPPTRSADGDLRDPVRVPRRVREVHGPTRHASVEPGIPAHGPAPRRAADAVVGAGVVRPPEVPQGLGTAGAARGDRRVL